MVLGRDVPSTIRVRGADRLAAALVLDADTGLVRGIAIEQTTGEALQHAVTAALTQPAAELPPGTPDRVLCATGLATPVRTALTAAGLVGGSVIVEVQPGPEAEDIFDSFLGRMAGRAQPDEFPTPADWQALIEQTAEFRRAEPWTRWSDEQDLAIELHLPGGPSRYTAVVMGQAGIQHGLALYPGHQLPRGLREPGPAEQAPQPPAGTVLITLDPPGEVPVELTGKAIRYGWPAEDDLVPAFIAFTATGPTEIGRDDAHRLTVGLAAVLAVDRRGPTLADVADKPITGSIRVDGQPVRFVVRHRPRRDMPPEPALRIHQAGHDLLPPDTPVTVGHLSWDALPDLRAAARVHRPAPADAPAPAGREVPLVVLSPDPRHGPSLTAKIANLDPYCVSAVDTGDGHGVLVLAGGEAAVILISLPADHPALTAFHRRYRQTRGRHVIMVADPASATGQGAVYGLFECHQPPPPRQPKTKPARRPAH
jgi:hypothetical protein